MVKGQSNSWHGVAVFTNISASVLLAALIGLGAFVNVKKIIDNNIPSDSFTVLNLDPAYWNVAGTLVDTATGILTTVAFASQDDIITRRELGSTRGGVALFLRLLTIKRGAEQVYHRQMSLERALLVLCSRSESLTSTV
ncbi:hypothetical protein C8R45DRAFT_940801 [Mycena sanguinolenta]|nr:hypothetical protein C8R45DRAFT_940801 [Mycena sanguinolenta]